MTENLPAKTKAANIRALLEKSKAQMAMALPKHLTADRLLRVAMTSIQKTPELMDCTPQSLLACVMMCAQLGLEPDQFLGQAYLVPYKNVCTLIPGYRGYIALARRSGEVQSVSSQVVYSNDRFVLQYGIDEKLEHVPAEGDRGEIKGAYVVFKYKDGSYSFDYMAKNDIDKIRARSKAKANGPWVTDYDEMAKKTVIKRHVKLVPLSVEFHTAVALEDRAMMGESQDDLIGLEEDAVAIDVGPVSDSDAADFDASIPDGCDSELLADFLQKTAKANGSSVDAVKSSAVKDLRNFWILYGAWAKKQLTVKGWTADGDLSLANSECPDNPGVVYNKKHCDACPKRQGCPAWE